MKTGNDKSRLRNMLGEFLWKVTANGVSVDIYKPDNMGFEQWTIYDKYGNALEIEYTPEDDDDDE